MLGLDDEGAPTPGAEGLDTTQADVEPPTPTCVLCNEDRTNGYVSSDLGYEGSVHKKCWRQKFKEGNGYDPGIW